MESTESGSDRPGDGTDRRLNVIQLLALSVVLGTAAGVLAHLWGLSWAWAVFATWSGAILGALCVTALLVLADRPARRPSEDGDLRATIEAWDEDLERETEEATRKPARSMDDAPIAASDLAMSRGSERGRRLG